MSKRRTDEWEQRVGRRTLGCVPGSISPLPSTPSWAATFSHLRNTINEKAFRRDGGLDIGFRLWHWEAAVRINWLSLCGTKNTTAFLLPICCTPAESVRSARFGIQRVMSCPDYLSLLFVYHIFLNSWQLCIKTVFLLHRHVFRRCISNVLP